MFDTQKEFLIDLIRILITSTERYGQIRKAQNETGRGIFV